MPTIIRPITAHQDETVEIKWVLADGQIFYARYSCPPRSVREARTVTPPAPDPPSPPERG